MESSKKIGKIIKRSRLSLGISQENLAALVGLSRPTITQIETGSRKLSADEVAAFADALQQPAEVILGMRKPVSVVLEEEDPSVAEAAATYAEEMRISIPQKNLKKFKEVLLYLLERLGAKPHVGETVIYKLLYFIDFDFYELFEEQLVGATYQKNRYGPIPMEFKEVIRAMTREGDIEKVRSEYFSYPQTKYLARREPALNVFSVRELKHIDAVINRLGDMNANQISEYSHGDVPWIGSEMGEIIDYEAVFYRRPPYSLRNYDEVLED